MTQLKIFNVLVLVIVFAGVFGLVGWSQAANCSGYTSENCYELQNPLGTTTDSIPALICKVLTFLSSRVMPPVAVFMALYASFLLLTSVGSPGKVTSARQVLVFTVIGAGIILLSVPIVALVMSVMVGGSTITDPSCTVQGASSTFIDTFIRLINWFSWFIAVLSVAVVLYSGFIYMTGRGEPQKVAMASKMIVYAVIGIAVAVIAFSIITLVKGFIGL